MMNRLLRIAYLGFLIFLAGCSSLQSIDSDWVNRILYTPTPVPVATATAASQPVATASDVIQPGSTTPTSGTLRIWLPPQFNPNANNQAANLLKQRLADFEAQHPEIKIDVRIKAEEGDADLLNSLSITNMAASAALPDLIALPRPALEIAAQKGLVRSLDEFSTELQKPNWYPYARELAKVDGMPYGIPFAGDTLVIAYRPDLVWIKTWDDILLSESQLTFAGASQQAEVGLSLYVSAGGLLVDAQGKPTLDQEILTQVLELFSKGRAATLFPDAVTNISTETQVLQEYRARRSEMAIVRYSGYRSSQDGLAQPLMGLNGSHFTFATGWVWALAGQNPESDQLSLELMEFLTADDFLSGWISQTGYLPTRQSTTAETASSPVPGIIEALQSPPSSDMVIVLGPVMQEAIVRVLNGEQPDAVARSVVARLK